MSVITLTSIKGSPGVTTLATAIGAVWPADRKVLLVEADPCGGDLAPRYDATVTGGLASLFAAARRSLAPEAIWEHVQRLPGGLPVLFGLTGGHQAQAVEQAWPAVARALAGLDADVVIDAGRLLPTFGGGIRDIIEATDTLVVVAEPTLEGVVHLRDALPGLAAELRSRRLLVVPTGAVGFSADQIATTLHVSVSPPMPNDPGAASTLANRGSAKKLAKSRLLRWATALVADLGIEATPAPGTPDTAPTAADRPFDQRSEAHESDDLPGDSALLKRFGPKWQAQCPSGAEQ